MGTMKIALGGILHETNTFSTVSTRYDDFRRTDADALTGALASSGFEQDSRHAVSPSADASCSVVPLFVAHATPSGRVSRLAFDRLLLELLDGIRGAMPLDGVLLEQIGRAHV